MDTTRQLMVTGLGTRLNGIILKSANRDLILENADISPEDLDEMLKEYATNIVGERLVFIPDVMAPDSHDKKIWATVPERTFTFYFRFPELKDLEDDFIEFISK